MCPFPHKQESSLFGAPKSPSPGQPERLAGLSTGGEVGCFIRLKCYAKWRTMRVIAA